jgi:dolichol-phosphate mannosyltransferase
MPDEILISIVIPVKNEEETLPALAREIDAAFAGQSYAWEVVWVDDGSTDRSRELMRAQPKPHRWIGLDKNHGQSAAFMAGFQAARGIWVGTLDGDGQNDPVDLPRQLARGIEKGVDMVNGIRAKRQDSWFRKISSKIGNGIRNAMTGNTVKDVGCSTRVVKRTAVLDLPFFHGLVQMKGYTIDEIPVNHRQRAGGASKYGLWNRAPSAARDLFGVRWLKLRNRNFRISDQGGAA